MSLGKFHDLLLKAILEKRLIRFTYQGKARIAEPHDYGMQKGQLRLLAYQVRGASTGKLPGWRWIEVPEMSDLEVLSDTFPGSRAEEANKHQVWKKKCWRGSAEDCSMHSIIGKRPIFPYT